MTSIRVLFVDDEEELVSATTERLAMRGVVADGLANGDEALKRIRENLYDVVVLDVKMPGLGGLEILKRIKGYRPDLPVILTTGHGSIRDGEEGLREGAFDYLIKPVDIEDLVNTIEEAVRG